MKRFYQSLFPFSRQPDSRDTKTITRMPLFTFCAHAHKKLLSPLLKNVHLSLSQPTQEVQEKKEKNKHHTTKKKAQHCD
jgi:hypothetical protein